MQNDEGDEGDHEDNNVGGEAKIRAEEQSKRWTALYYSIRQVQVQEHPQDTPAGRRIWKGM